ncbi:CopD family protein [Meiothermus sp. CFH 77666]|uniref:copper resistance D family protein n=1 Tax=Meiothermus sp. CFH 77666 TaxID=2817942 RepID=UPI001FB194E6|nr:CopD family protein [Meiothermus sp. CFH 77666]
MPVCKEPVASNLTSLYPTAMPHEHDNTQSVLRAALYLGVFLLLGAGVFARYVGPEAARAQRWRLWYLLSGGFLLAMGATLYGVYHVTWMLGDTTLMGSYLLETRQGNLLLVRLGLLVGLLGLSMGWFRLDRWLYPSLALGLLLTLTFTSHAGAAGGLQPWADLLHLGLGVVWAGALLALAVVWPGTRLEAVLRATRRLSALGLVSVVGMALLGVYLAWARLGELSQLWSTAYGQRLLLKLGLVALVVGVAAVNRLWLLPRLQAKRVRGLSPVGLEAALIAGVLAVSGLLATTEPPPAPGLAAPRMVNISESVGNQRYVGQLFSQGGLIHLYLDLRDAEGNLLEGGPALKVRAQRGAELLEEVAGPFYRSQYHLALIAEAQGVWEVQVELPEKTLEFTLDVRP